MAIQRIIIALLIATSIVACVESEIDYSYKFKEQGYFVSGLLNDQEVQVIVQEVLSPLNITEVKTLSGLEVFLTDATGLKLKLEETGNGLFKTIVNFKPDVKSSYTLIITTPEGDSLFAGPQAVVNPIKISSFYLEKNNQNNKAKLFTEFIDPPVNQNYYAYRIIHFWKGKSIHSPQKLLALSPLNDEDFSGLTKTFIDDATITTYIGGGWQPVDSIGCYLYSLSEELYLFLKSIQDYKGTYGESMYEQPMFVNAFIDNGYGFFGSYGVDSAKLYREDF